MIGLIDIDGKLPNLALMKISTYYKSLGEIVELTDFAYKKYDLVYASCLFTWNRQKCLDLLELTPNIIFGGTGWDLKTVLPSEIENCKPDYDLYPIETIYSRSCKGGISTKESKEKKAQIITNMGLGFSSRGCPNHCPFCIVPIKEGPLRQASEIKDIMAPRSKVITLNDNNLTADPYCVDKLQEIRDRKLTVDISQGVDVRLMTPEKAKALSEVRHLRSLHYAWDLMKNEASILKGIQILSEHVKKWRHMVYILIGFNTTYEEDLYRVIRLKELGIKPYAMKYNNQQDNARLNHFARWVNGNYYKVCDFQDYEPWKKERGISQCEKLFVWERGI